VYPEGAGDSARGNQGAPLAIAQTARRVVSRPTRSSSSCSNQADRGVGVLQHLSGKAQIQAIHDALAQHRRESVLKVLRPTYRHYAVPEQAAQNRSGPVWNVISSRSRRLLIRLGITHRMREFCGSKVHAGPRARLGDLYLPRSSTHRLASEASMLLAPMLPMGNEKQTH